MELPSPESELGGTPAPYGQSCEACARSKCKCMLIGSRQACERCHRLGRECRPSNNKRKRATGGRTSRIDEAVSKTVQLERRLDELVTSLQQPARLDERVSTSGSEDHLLRTGSVALPPSSLASNVVVDVGHSNEGREDLWTAARLTHDEASNRLNTFRTTYLKWAPFIYIPSTTTSADLYNTRPILWFSIMLLATSSDQEIHRLDNVFRQTIAHEMVVKSKKSIDILLGLLVFISWYNHHCRTESGNVKISLSLLVSMAISLENDLKVPRISQPQQMLNRHLYRHWPEHATQARTMEERRAFLWCFFSSAVISSYLRNDPLRWSPFLEDCLREVLGKSEWAGDEVLVQLVRAQLILEKANIMRRSDDALQSPDHLSPPPSHYVQLLQVQLRQLRDGCSLHLRESDIVNLHYHAIEFSIAELGLTPQSQTFQNPLQQRKIRYTCLASTKAWFECFLLCPPSEYMATAFTSAIQSSHCLGMLFYLSTPDEPVWTKEDVQETNALDIVDRTIAYMEAAVQASGEKDGGSLCAHVQLYRSIRGMWAAKLAELDAGVRSEKAQRLGEGEDHMELDAAAFGEMLELGSFDTDWLFAWPPLGNI